MNMMGDAIVMALATDTARPDTAERLGQLFDTHHRRLYNLARRMTRSPEEARDAVQDTFLRAAHSPKSIPYGPTHEEAWLVRVLINICKDAWRKQAVRSRAAAPPPPIYSYNQRHGAESELVARSTIWRALDAPPRHSCDVRNRGSGYSGDRSTARPSGRHRPLASFGRPARTGARHWNNPMNNLRDRLRDADPVPREPGLSPDTVASLRRAVIAAAETAPARPHLWGRQLAMAACLA